jgi:hypothetical protein
MAIGKEVMLGSSPEYPLPRNTFATYYAADSSTRLIILNADKPADVSITSALVYGRTILSIVPVKNYGKESEMPVEINVTEDSISKGESIVIEAGSLNPLAVEATRPAIVSNVQAATENLNPPDPTHHDHVVEVIPSPIPSGIVYANMPLFLAYDNADGMNNLIWDIEQLLRK